MGLNTANGLNGPEFMFFSMMAIANDRVRYQISVYSPLHPHSLTPKLTVNGSRPLRFPQILPFSAPETLLHLSVSHRLPQLRKPVTFSDRECRVTGAGMHLEPFSYPPRFGFSQIQGFSQASQRRLQVAVFQRGTTIVVGWSLYGDFLSSESWGGPR